MRPNTIFQLSSVAHSPLASRSLFRHSANFDDSYPPRFLGPIEMWLLSFDVSLFSGMNEIEGLSMPYHIL